MKPSFAALVAVLLLVTACPKQSPPPATSIIRGMAGGAVEIATATLAR